MMNKTKSASNSKVKAEDKIAIYKHPLFPLLSILFEKCERCTMTPDSPEAKTADKEIAAFVKGRRCSPATAVERFFTVNAELDDFMMKAVQVMRIHLMELEKVNELCHDFCSRYTQCLKGKMQSENLLRGPDEPVPLAFSQVILHPSSPDSNSIISSSPPAALGPVNAGNSATSCQEHSVVKIVSTRSQPSSTILLAPEKIVSSPMSPRTGVTLAAVTPGSIVSGSTVYQMVRTSQGLIAQPLTMARASSTGVGVISGSTPLSKIGALSSLNSTERRNSTTQADPTPGSSRLHDYIAVACNLNEEDEEADSKPNAKRGVLPKKATNVMRSWLFQHIVHPYPTEDEKKEIALQTNLTLLQVNNWFINARRRILQPMLDASNPETKPKKSKQPANKNRFWPESIARPNGEVSIEANGIAAKNDEKIDREMKGIDLSQTKKSNIDPELKETNRNSSSLEESDFSFDPPVTLASSNLPDSSPISSEDSNTPRDLSCGGIARLKTFTNV